MTDLTETAPLLRAQGVTAPAGFRAAGIAAGIKASGALDLALVFSEGPDYAAAGVFTRNQVKAAPVLWTQQVLTTGRLRAVILNSGGANALSLVVSAAYLNSSNRHARKPVVTLY